MQQITTLYLVPVVSLSISINSEFIDSESFPILRSSLSWYCRDSCIYRHTPPALFFGYNLVNDYNEPYCRQYDATLPKFHIRLLILIQCLNCREIR